MTREEVLKVAKPILFNTEMVRAILSGRKTVTRRIIKPQPTYSQNAGFSWKGGAYGTDFLQTIEGAAYNFRCTAPFKAGDILYVRETWAQRLGCYWHKAGFIPVSLVIEKWRPSIHMPKEATRIFLRVKDVRVERLQDITLDGVHKERVDIHTHAIADGERLNPNSDFSLERFETLWNSTIKKQDLNKYGWNANPLVWVIEFERMEVE